MSLDETKLRQSELGELCWITVVPRLDICSRLARIGPKIGALSGSDVCRISALVRVVKERQEATAPKSA